MRVPQDIANLLAVAIRDLLWYKPKVLLFLAECDVPLSVMVEVRRLNQEKMPTIKIVHFVLGQLAEKGEEGSRAILAMLTKIHYWKDVHTVPAERKNQAVASLKAFQQGYLLYEAQKEYQQEQERRMQVEREARSKPKSLDHAKLQAFRDEFDTIHATANSQDRGNSFQDLMNRVFDYYCEESRGPFNRTGEQIDGLFYFDKHWYYVEVRWKATKASAADISVLRDRAKSAYGGDTKALFISFNGFSPECIESLTGQSDERVILMDGYDLRCVLSCQIGFDILLAEKQLALVRDKKPFCSAQEIIRQRSDGR